MKLPNIFTLMRFLLIPIIIFLLYSSNPNDILLSIIFFIVAVFTDWLDGFIARKYKLKSVFGTFFDPIVDKILILGIFLVFVDLKLIPLWLVLLLIFREFVASGIRQTCSNTKKIVGANWMGKSKFIMQLLVIIYTQVFLYFSYIGKTIIFFNNTGVYYSTLIMTIISLIYILNFAYWHREEMFSDI